MHAIRENTSHERSLEVSGKDARFLSSNEAVKMDIYIDLGKVHELLGLKKIIEFWTPSNGHDE